MRTLALFTAAALAASAGAASAQLVDPRTAAGAAGQITGQTTPGIDTPAPIDRSADPALRSPSQTDREATTLPGAARSGSGASTSPLPAEPDAGADTPRPPPAAGGPPRTRTDERPAGEAEGKDAPAAARNSPANPAISEPRPLISPSPSGPTAP